MTLVLCNVFFADLTDSRVFLPTFLACALLSYIAVESTLYFDSVDFCLYNWFAKTIIRFFFVTSFERQNLRPIGLIILRSLWRGQNTKKRSSTIPLDAIQSGRHGKVGQLNLHGLTLRRSVPKGPSRDLPSRPRLRRRSDDLFRYLGCPLAPLRGRPNWLLL